mmetsp:Transcript_47479/g.79523  ORF Transcript_47479/g.79523 Transcript_47479/m.79523 type:complete len:282 (-) Transcript_47479:1451-2296(-)
MSASWLAIANGASSSSGSCRVWRWNCCGIRKSVPIAAAVFCRPSSFSAVQRRNTLKQDTSPFVFICLQTCLQFLCQFRQLMMHYLQQPADVAFLVKPHVTYQLHYFLSYISIGQNSFVQNPIEFFSPAPLLFVLVSQWQLPFLILFDGRRGIAYFLNVVILHLSALCLFFEWYLLVCTEITSGLGLWCPLGLGCRRCPLLRLSKMAEILLPIAFAALHIHFISSATSMTFLIIRHIRTNIKLFIQFNVCSILGCNLATRSNHRRLREYDRRALLSSSSVKN